MPERLDKPRDVILRLVSRPLRIIAFVRTRTEFEDAVRVNSHLWGGKTNIILPIPDSPDAKADVFRVVRSYNPDCLLFFSDDAGDIDDYLGQFPAPRVLLSGSDLTAFIDSSESFLIDGKRVPHLARVLRSSMNVPLTASQARIIDRQGPRSFHTSLMFGDPSHRFIEFLNQHVAARPWRAPRDLGSLVRLWAAAETVVPPLGLTMHEVKTGSSWTLMVQTDPLHSMRLDRVRTLFIFVDDEQGVRVPAACWNARRQPLTANKLIVLRRDLPSINDAIDHLRRGHFDEVLLLTDGDETAANQLLDEFRSAAASTAWRVQSAVQYNIGSDATVVNAHWGIAETTTRSLLQDGTFRFTPRIPTGHDAKSLAIAYDCELEYSNGVHPAFPETALASRLLQNGQERLRRAITNEGGAGARWIRQSAAVRPQRRGIAGVCAPGSEIVVHLHDDPYWIAMTLQARGLAIRPNDATRYAHAVVRRFGGIDRTLALIREGGGHLLKAMNAHRAEASGFSEQQLASFVTARVGMGQGDANALVKRWLPDLLEAALIIRGVALKCPSCRLREWYALEELGEHVECHGCALVFQLDSHGIGFSFKANELARRFIQYGGHAVLSTAAVLRSIAPGGLIEFGGEVMHGDGSTVAGEADLLLMLRDMLLVAECKDFDRLGEDEIQDLAGAIPAALDVAGLVGAETVLIGVTTSDQPGELIELVTGFGQEAGRRGCELHLLVNDKFFLNGNEEVTDLARLSLAPSHERPGQRLSMVGELLPSIGFGTTGGAFETDVLRGWREECTVTGEDPTGGTGSP
jgi:hypothetical protein